MDIHNSLFGINLASRITGISYHSGCSLRHAQWRYQAVLWLFDESLARELD